MHLPNLYRQIYKEKFRIQLLSYSSLCYGINIVAKVVNSAASSDYKLNSLNVKK